MPDVVGPALMWIQKLSILVPVYNESATVERLIRRLADVPFEIEREIVVVDDASTDGSRNLLRRLAEDDLITLVEHDVNRGKGASVRTALARATGQVVVVQDADLELDPNDLPELLEPILAGETLVCYGSRFMGGVSWSLRRRPTYWANLLLNGVSNMLNGLKITDFNTCYKMMTTQVMRGLRLSQDGFAMEPEVTAKLACLGYRIVERPVTYRPRNKRGGKKIRPGDLLRYLVTMIRCRFFWSPGAFQRPEPAALGHRVEPG